MILSSNTSVFNQKRHSLLSVKTTRVDKNNYVDDYETVKATADSIDCLIADLRPLIHYTAQFSRLIHWNNHNTQKKYTILLIFGWILWWTMHRLILSLSPILLIAAKLYSHTQQQHNQQGDNDLDGLVQDLTEIRDAIYFLPKIEQWIQKSDTICRLYNKHYSTASRKQRRDILFSVACLFAIVYVGWINLLYQQMITSASSIAWFVILMIMCFNSPWANPICAACIHVLKPLIHNSLDKSNIITLITCNNVITTKQEQQLQPDDHLIYGYCFELYHHQRWWLPTGWSNLLLPQDRPVWSDIYLETTPSIDEFKLPPPSYVGKPNKHHQQRIVSWTWVDPNWSKYQATTTDDNNSQEENCWEYGSWNWKSWAFLSTGLGVCTRRQKWHRFAQRKEYWIDIAPTDTLSLIEEKRTAKDVECSTGSICGSVMLSVSSSIYTTNSSLLHDDEGWLNNNNTTPSLFITTTTATATSSATNTMEEPIKPILISNIYEKCSTRRLSLQYVTFNTSPKATIISGSLLQRDTNQEHLMWEEQHEMYKEFCTTPKPQKQKKRFSTAKRDIAVSTNKEDDTMNFHAVGHIYNSIL